MVKNSIKKAIRNIVQESQVYEYWFRYRRKRVFIRWQKNSKNGPMPAFAKEQQIRLASSLNKAKVLIETGTFLGETVYALRNTFKKMARQKNLWAPSGIGSPPSL